MTKLFVSGGRLAVDTTAVTGSEPSKGGVRRSGLSAKAAVVAPTRLTGGSPVTDSGQLAIVDATAGLPAGTVVLHGLPRAPSGALCVSSGAVAYHHAGVPFAANGAVASSAVA